jgi:hypothetical protein
METRLYLWLCARAAPHEGGERRECDRHGGGDRACPRSHALDHRTSVATIEAAELDPQEAASELLQAA